MFDAQLGQDAALERLADPNLDPGDLMVIAGAFPALAPQVAGHPRLYPDLAAWLKLLGSPEVDAVLAARAPAAEALSSPPPASVAPAASAQPFAGDAVARPRQAPPPAQALVGDAVVQPSQVSPAVQPFGGGAVAHPSPMSPTYGGAGVPAASGAILGGAMPGTPAPPWGSGAPRRPKRWPWAVGAGVLAVVLGVVAALVLRPDPSSGGRSGTKTPAPDIREQPAWGEPIEPGELLGGGLDWVLPYWSGDGMATLDQNTALVYGSSFDEEDEIASVIGAVDLDAAELKWSIDFMDDQPGFSYEIINSARICPLGDKGLLASFEVSDDDLSAVTARVDAEGRIIGVLEDAFCVRPIGELVVLVGGLNGSSTGELFAVDPDESERELWKAEPVIDEPSFYFERLECLESETVAFVLTADGYVDAKTGELAPFGADAVDEDGRAASKYDEGIAYAITGDGVVLRGDAANGHYRISGVDPKTGGELWQFERREGADFAEETDLLINFREWWSLVGSGGGYVFVPEGGIFRALDTKTGQEAFSLEAEEFLELAGDTVLMRTYDDDTSEEGLAGFNLKDGSETFAITARCPEYQGTARLGSEVLYLVCRGSGPDPLDFLIAFDAANGGQKLWSMRFPEETWGDAFLSNDENYGVLVSAAGRLFFVATRVRYCQDTSCEFRTWLYPLEES
ncbi:MAG: PQQ-binding-like beta-propeller repeat protein [Bifidobacteriaceae bacterium]|jgi:outer membrane protein assembly factor BamB|nr:PQQ-binding-like beta-propeller repeat protein [Bifidobacteriaceae bacterium]